MKNQFSALEPSIQEHLAAVRETSGLPAGAKSLEILAEGWLAKERIFLEQSMGLGMEGRHECDDPHRGFLALTCSGSLVAVGPRGEKGCHAVYVSIGGRYNVPSRAESPNAAIVHSVSVGQGVFFTNGPVQQTSPIYKLAVLAPTLAAGQQNKILSEAAATLSSEFQAVENTISGQVNG
ncbi:MAG: hypothetical protein B0D92_04715 [Spirochaeta sp. LUC14_002_19_P3]|nr:MAG: hypothetical protein B0D92_04715 [Spirochaeta sp. LUC14_002_19_P3]